MSQKSLKALSVMVAITLCCNIGMVNAANVKSQSFVVGITIVESCSVANKQLNSHNNISINCSNGTPYKIENSYEKHDYNIQEPIYQNNINQNNISNLQKLTTIYF